MGSCPEGMVPGSKGGCVDAPSNSNFKKGGTVSKRSNKGRLRPKASRRRKAAGGRFVGTNGRPKPKVFARGGHSAKLGAEGGKMPPKDQPRDDITLANCGSYCMQAGTTSNTYYWGSQNYGDYSSYPTVCNPGSYYFFEIGDPEFCGTNQQCMEASQPFWCDCSGNTPGECPGFTADCCDDDIIPPPPGPPKGRLGRIWWDKGGKAPSGPPKGRMPRVAYKRGGRVNTRRMDRGGRSSGGRDDQCDPCIYHCPDEYYTSGTCSADCHLITINNQQGSNTECVGTSCPGYCCCSSAISQGAVDCPDAWNSWCGGLLADCNSCNQNQPIWEVIPPPGPPKGRLPRHATRRGGRAGRTIKRRRR